MWFKVLIVCALIGAVIGYLSSNNGNRSEDAMQGCLAGLFAGGYCLLKLFFLGLTLMFIIWMFDLLFG